MRGRWMTTRATCTEPTWRMLPNEQEEDGRTARGDTHICLDKQLPCLYPFPQRSQRRSAGARFPSVFIWAPSLARRLRPLGMGLPSADSELLGEALRATGGSWLGLFMLRER